MLKLKRKLQYSGHQYCETVRPDCVKDALLFLKENNEFYQNIEININNLDTDVLAVTNCVDDEKLETESSSLSDPCNSHEIVETSNCRKLSDTASKENQN